MIQGPPEEGECFSFSLWHSTPQFENYTTMKTNWPGAKGSHTDMWTPPFGSWKQRTPRNWNFPRNLMVGEGADWNLEPAKRGSCLSERRCTTCQIIVQWKGTESALKGRTIPWPELVIYSPVFKHKPYAVWTLKTDLVFRALSSYQYVPFSKSLSLHSANCDFN